MLKLKNFFIMKKVCYVVPEVEFVEVQVELGFAGSDMEGIDPDGGEHM